MQSETTHISEQLLKEITDSIGLNNHNIKLITYSQNFVYDVSDGINSKILRITSDKHRTRDQILAELQWIDLLKANGIHACAAIKTNGKSQIISFESPTDTLHCVLFERAKGIPISSEMLNENLYYLHGALIGKIHKVTRKCPIEISNNRFRWSNNRLYTSDILEFLPDNIKEKISEISKELISIAEQLPQTTETYRLIHFDLHYDNFYIHSKEAYLFDFDNCSNGYFVNDIAKALWASVFTYHRKSQFQEKNPFLDKSIAGPIMECVWNPFWDGYRSENEINKSWFEQIPLFFELIHLKEFVHHYRHKVPYRSEELKNIFLIEQKQIERREIPICFDFKNGKAK